jgi:hypothetical protein
MEILATRGSLSRTAKRLCTTGMRFHGMTDSHKENNWFRSNEKVLLEQASALRKKKMREAAAKYEQETLDQLRQAHWLKCPKCGHDMKTTTLEEIEVETCTFCKGIYFDRGEIETLLMRKTSRRFSFYRKFFGLD